MPGNVKRLSELLSEMWDRAHHIFPASASRRLVQWLALSDSLVVEDDSGYIGTESIPYPAIWASGTADIYWGRGVWAPSTTSESIVYVEWEASTNKANYPVVLTVDTAALVTAGYAAADGSDFRVTVDGNEIYRWFGTGANAFNQVATKIWMNLNFGIGETKIVYLTYGGANAISADDDYKPIINLDLSTNTTWEYAEFGEDDGLRTGAWATGGVTGLGLPSFYGGNHGAAADPWIEIGIMCDSASEAGYYYVHNPCEILSANFANGEKYAATAVPWSATIKSSPDGSSWGDEYIIAKPADSVWEAWNRDETLDAGAKYVAMWFIPTTPGVATYLECANCTLVLNSSYTPAITYV